MSNNLLRRNKQGSNIVRCAKHCQGIGTPNYEFIVSEFCKHLKPRVIMREAVVSGFILNRTNLTKYQVKEIYKYIDIDENDVREDLVWVVCIKIWFYWLLALSYLRLKLY